MEAIVLLLLGTTAALIMLINTISILFEQKKAESYLEEYLSDSEKERLDIKLSRLRNINENDQNAKEYQLLKIKNELQEIISKIPKKPKGFKYILKSMNQNSLLGQEKYIEKIIINSKKTNFSDNHDDAKTKAPGF